MVELRGALDALIEARLLSIDALLAGPFRIEESSRRHQSWKVITEAGPSYLVKGGGGRAGPPGTLAHEARVYAFLSRSEGARTMGPYLAPCHLYSAERDLLVLELIRHARSLHGNQLGRARPPRLASRQLGRALGRLHSLPVHDPRAPVPRGEKPSVLGITRPDVTLLSTTSAANLGLMRILQGTPEIDAHLASLGERWEPAHVVHGDLKWDNCLVHPAPHATRTTRLKLVDWEFGGLGDGRWDVGSAFAAYLVFWLLSIPISDRRAVAAALERARIPLASVQPAVRRFWTAYRRSCSPASSRPAEWLEVSLLYCAARLLQYAYEHLHDRPVLAPVYIYMVQLALNIFQRPFEATVHLLGITEP